MMNIGICDDNLQDIMALNNCLEICLLKFNFPAQIALKTSSQSEMLCAIKRGDIDILFLDIDFNDKLNNGINFALKLRELNKDFHLIFVTGFFNYCLEAYSCKTFDYIFKPVTVQNLSPVIKRLMKDFSLPNNKFITISGIGAVNVRHIIYIERNKEKVVLHLKNGDCYKCNSSLNSILSKLPNTFERCHRSYIINNEHVTFISKKTKSVHFQTGDSCPYTSFIKLVR